jgi:hypothetical protein
MNASRAHAAVASQRSTCVPAPHCSCTVAAGVSWREGAREKLQAQPCRAPLRRTAARTCPRGASSTVSSNIARDGMAE